jgi:transposase-like protein
VTERERDKNAARRLAILRHAEEVTGNVALTCRYYGITRQAFYQWRRHAAGGSDALRDRSRRPQSCPHELPRSQRTARCPDPTPPAGNSAEDLPVAGCQRSDNATGSGRLRFASSCVPSANELWDQMDNGRPDSSSAHTADSPRFAEVPNEKYSERLPWRMHGRYDDGRTGLCRMCDASITSASRSQISTS